MYFGQRQRAAGDEGCKSECWALPCKECKMRLIQTEISRTAKKVQLQFPCLTVYCLGGFLFVKRFIFICLGYSKKMLCLCLSCAAIMLQRIFFSFFLLLKGRRTRHCAMEHKKRLCVHYWGCVHLSEAVETAEQYTHDFLHLQTL